MEGLEPPRLVAIRLSDVRVFRFHHIRMNKPGGSRTHGLLVKSQPLSPLSYGPSLRGDEGENRTLTGRAHGLLRPTRLPVPPLRRTSDPGRTRTSNLRVRTAALRPLSHGTNRSSRGSSGTRTRTGRTRDPSGLANQRPYPSGTASEFHCGLIRGRKFRQYQPDNTRVPPRTGRAR